MYCTGITGSVPLATHASATPKPNPSQAQPSQDKSAQTLELSNPRPQLFFVSTTSFHSKIDNVSVSTCILDTRYADRISSRSPYEYPTDIVFTAPCFILIDLSSPASDTMGFFDGWIDWTKTTRSRNYRGSGSFATLMIIGRTSPSSTLSAGQRRAQLSGPLNHRR